VPDNSLHLTADGRSQALDAGKRLKELIGDESVRFIVSPYVRAKETFNGILYGGTFNEVNQNRDVSYDIRIREQDFGNFDSPDMKHLLEEKKDFGALYYRFPNGESLADCFDRASSFLESLYRSFSHNTYTNCVVVGHGIMISMTLMRMMKISFDQYASLLPLQNCEFVVLTRPPDDGRYGITFTWAFGEDKNFNGLRLKDPPEQQTEIWDGNPSSPLLSSAPRKRISSFDTSPHPSVVGSTDGSPRPQEKSSD
jgi:broad specificity phosphatase PhoE